MYAFPSSPKQDALKPKATKGTYSAVATSLFFLADFCCHKLQIFILDTNHSSVTQTDTNSIGMNIFHIDFQLHNSTTFL